MIKEKNQDRAILIRERDSLKNVRTSWQMIGIVAVSRRKVTKLESDHVIPYPPTSRQLAC